MCEENEKFRVLFEDAKVRESQEAWTLRQSAHTDDLRETLFEAVSSLEEISVASFCEII